MTIFLVEGMDCAGCARKVEAAAAALPGVSAARVDFATGRLVIEGVVDPAAVGRAVEALGYRVVEAARPASGVPAGFVRYLLGRPSGRASVAGAALLALAAALDAAGVRGAGLGYLLAAAAAGAPVARRGLAALRVEGLFGIETLMTIATIGAFAIGEAAEGATLILLFAVGEALEGYVADRARSGVRGLAALAPETAVRLRAGREETVPVEALVVGETVLVRPGARVPVDGTVTAGEGEVNQAPITGESAPVRKAAGDPVFAGTVNGGGALEVRVDRAAGDSTLARMARLVAAAESNRARVERVVDRFARVYTPAVVVLAVATALGPPLLLGAPFLDAADGTRGWLYRSLALLVVACPCALVISAPVTIVSAVAAAARRGILFKGGARLEALAGVRAFAFDKTGTLTRGAPALAAVRAEACVDGARCAPCDDVLAVAASLERRSDHPVAAAVVAAAAARGLDTIYPPGEDVEESPGRGLRGRVGGRRYALGRHDLLCDGHGESERVRAWTEEAEARGETVMTLCDDDGVRGYLTVADEIRPEAAAVAAALHAAGVRTAMLTGDNETVAARIAAAVGIDDVRAGLLPEEKVEAVRSLAAAHGGVAMVGDGVNDAPALAAATVGIAVGGAASAQALETADVVLMADGLGALPQAVRLARSARRIIAENVAASVGIKAAFVVLALAGLAPLWGAVVADMGVSLAVTLNGMRPLAERG